MPNAKCPDLCAVIFEWTLYSIYPFSENAKIVSNILCIPSKH